MASGNKNDCQIISLVCGKNIFKSTLNKGLLVPIKTKEIWNQHDMVGRTMNRGWEDLDSSPGSSLK